MYVGVQGQNADNPALKICSTDLVTYPIISSLEKLKQAIQKQDSQCNDKRKKKEKKLKSEENLESLSEKVEKEEIKGGKNIIMQAKRKLS